MYDVVVIGSGPGGYVAAIRAAQLGLKTACVEKSKPLGGTCLNVGCIPSKSLLQSSELYWLLRNKAQEHGIHATELSYDFTHMMQRKDKVVKGFNDGIAALFKKNRIDRFEGEASFLNPQTLKIAGQEVSARHFIIATGSEPIPLPFLPFDEEKILSSTGALALKKVPKKLIVVGAGVIGVELGSVYKRLGSEVTFIEFLDRICPTFDEAVSKTFQEILEKQGMTFHLSSKVTSGKVTPTHVELLVDKNSYEADVVLIAIGRRAYTQGLNLQAIGITLDSKGMIPVDGAFRTAQPHIFAIGDVIDGPMLAHKASDEGVAAAEIIAGLSPHIEYIAIPNVVYTLPEVAAVGITEREAKAMNLTFKTGTFPFKINSRAKCSGEDEGFVKMIAEARTGRLLGIHIIGAHAGELIAEATLALERKTTALELANTSHAHPTYAEAIKEAALSIAKHALHR